MGNGKLPFVMQQKPKNKEAPWGKILKIAAKKTITSALSG